MADNEVTIITWTEEEKEKIKEEIHLLLIEGWNGTKVTIFNKIRHKYPPTSDVRTAYSEFSKIYYSVQKEIAENTNTEKDLLVPKSIERYEMLYEIAIKEKRYRDAKAVVDSMVKIIGVDKMQQMLKEDKNGELSFHLDFGM